MQEYKVVYREFMKFEVKRTNMRKIYLLQAMVILMMLVGCAGNSGDIVDKSSSEDVTVTEGTESDEAASNATEHFTSESTTQEPVSSDKVTENASTESDKQESVEPVQESAESTDSTTADDYYSIWTDLSASEVESFALGVKEDILSGNWESLSQKISYPITVSGVTYSDSGAFSSEDWGSILNQDFLSAIQGETCHEMFSNWEGCMLGTGQVWISSVDGSLKVIAINL